MSRTVADDLVEILPDAVAAFFAADGPALLDVVTDPNALSVPTHITGDEVLGFAGSLSKVALNGGVREVWDIARSNLRNIPRP